MSVSLSLLVLLSCLFSLSSSTDSSVQPSCSKALTHNDTHKHLSKYIGFTSELEGVHSDKTYKYKIGVCVEVDRDNAPGCGIVQYEHYTHKNGTIETRRYCIGLLSKSQVTETNDHVWVELTYSGGDRYGSHCNGENRKGRLVFICDPLITGMGKFEFLEENRDDDLCYYLFTIASSQVCGNSITVGDVILILMSCLVVIWLILMLIGFLYKRFFLGSKGYEQIPLIDCYRGFGNLEADGCDFVCRSKGSTPPSQYKPPAPPFSAETDEETDEEKDDNLLPM
ncbi:PREDICTED: cation-dependent mannose-6-phosphate receptor-like [Amphimedon queenslandica]|uniref:MRH domain-containing protein n=1 Tax=Amphimedon queenslandica TaxID=400682 RepID=A0A1X7VM10_AMPQE|nr:PREDICTED: cation-dependent mannose-6-phosphate receptor-like [Amphimedon queenslandica]XP_019862025.1 PREDICTED: cation-dependent mannose-6-phosphate receptor-like [Amphimedon queenslandica]XP_019862033.1 PREDICTED: cation-dependent mannose-6-phosphate receptor-like [Amphimedon queenslandica]|eukprot:XP_011409630.1 PREDICTED: cation-dependent mannose-6-phosphate receptor-like [Amphimedon queenslandica]